jgi:hypothetical protein
LQKGFVFAEEGVRAVLELLGIISPDSTTEFRDLDPVIDAYGEAVTESDGTADLTYRGPAAQGVLAAAIDHGSPGWQGLVGSLWLHSFGEPPAMVSVNGSVYVACDPPVSVGGFPGGTDQAWASEYLGVTGDWQEVPSEFAGDPLTAAAWARQNVGTQGRPAEADRLPLNFEVPLEYPDSLDAPWDPQNLRRSVWFQHSIADPLHVGIELAMGADLMDHAAAVADWLEHARELLVTPLTQGYEAAGGQVDLGEHDVPPYALSLTLAHRSTGGRFATAVASDKAWRRVLSRLRAGELSWVELEGGVANGAGQLQDVQPWGGLRIGAQLAADPHEYGPPAHLTVKISEPLRKFVPGPFVGGLTGRAVESLPVVGGWVDAGWNLSLGDGPSRYEQFCGVDVRRDPRTSVRGPAWRVLLGPGHLELLGGRAALEAAGVFTEFREVGALLLAQCGAQPQDCTWEQRAAMVEVLAPLLPHVPER